jgi:ubiquinone/menaquinone biosynthesis C-methylase UbiE
MSGDIAPPSSVPSGNVNYADWWKPPSEVDARVQIVTYEDKERFERTGEEERQRVAPFITPTSTVLDLGCGIGRVAFYVAPLCRTLWAVDVSPEMLHFARQRLADFPNVRFAFCSNTKVPDVPDKSVDFVYSIIVLQHLEREDAFLLMTEVVRMLRPGGKALFTWPNLQDEYYLNSFLSYATTGAVHNPSRARMYTMTELECILPQAGFAEVTMQDGRDIVTICTR